MYTTNKIENWMYAGEKWVCVRKSRLFQRPRFSGRWSSCRCWVSRELFLLYDLVPCFCENSTNCLIAWRVQHQYHQAQSSIQEREDPIQVDVLKEEKMLEKESRAANITRILLQNTSNTWYTRVIEKYLEIWCISTKEFSMFFFSFLTFNAAHKQFSSIHSYSYEICTTVRRRSSTLYLM